MFICVTLQLAPIRPELLLQQGGLLSGLQRLPLYKLSGSCGAYPPLDVFKECQAHFGKIDGAGAIHCPPVDPWTATWQQWNSAHADLHWLRRAHG
ncbi:hypothetical protein CEXT_737731 [Caerostris extrusa]|uniref:Uncharacterized protein n=1 Tax=Caerostris extrusa TaxID=172846 RepID=A0AAV4MPN4_CAEEX|nr:hypothetical protein CEXT_737731 [Caerostris extrusa]